MTLECLTLGRTRKFIPPPWYKGCGLMEPLPRVFDMLQSKRFCLSWKAFDLLNKTSYTLWVMALLKACGVTNSGRHLDRHLGFYQELEIRLKPQEMVMFMLDM